MIDDDNDKDIRVMKRPKRKAEIVNYKESSTSNKVGCKQYGWPLCSRYKATRKIWRCETCGETFIRSQDLRRHDETIHCTLYTIY